MHQVIAKLAEVRVVPVIRTSTAALAETAVRWLHDAGMRCFEITLTIPDAIALIETLARDKSLFIGAGTVPDRRAADDCLKAGATFLITPWVDPEVIAAAHEAGAAGLPGTMTPTEVRAAVAAGADAVKVFPASSAGGPGHIRALRSVFPKVAFCPTGGVDVDTAPAYFAAGASFVGMGGKLVDEKLLAAGDKPAITDIATRVLALPR